jgi:hypothetical protein
MISRLEPDQLAAVFRDAAPVLANAAWLAVKGDAS